MRTTEILLTALVAMLPAASAKSNRVNSPNDPLLGEPCHPSQYAGYCAGQILQCSSYVCDFFNCKSDDDCEGLPNTHCSSAGCTYADGGFLTAKEKKYYGVG